MAIRAALHTWAGQVPYQAALAWQDTLVRARQKEQLDDLLLLMTHPPTYTAGRFSDIEVGRRDAHPEIPVVQIDRGGELTYHGPGQVIAYPIIRLADAAAAGRYVHSLEQALIDTVQTYGIEAERREGYPGVWVGRDKLAAVGVRVTRRVSKHGVALNVDPDMSHFTGIVPCGIQDGGVTSMALLGVRAPVAEVADRLAFALGRSLRLILRRVSPAELGLHPTTA